MYLFLPDRFQLAFFRWHDAFLYIIHFASSDVRAAATASAKLNPQKRNKLPFALDVRVQRDIYDENVMTYNPRLATVRARTENATHSSYTALKRSFFFPYPPAGAFAVRGDEIIPSPPLHP